jgi:hopanoid biosynthesis associated RND transporter like protein HpnN
MKIDRDRPVLEAVDQALGRSLGRLVRWVTSHAGAVVTAIALLTVGIAAWTLLHIGFNMDHKRLLSPDLPFQRTARRFAKYFPSLDDALLIVVDGQTPERAREGADRLVARLQQRTDVFRHVYVPGSSDFFARNGLLYRTPEELQTLVDELIPFQPVIGELVRDPTIGRLTALIRQGLEATEGHGVDPAGLAPLLDQIGHATVEVFSDYPVAVSWEDLMLTGSAIDPGRRWVVIADPKLDFDALLPAAKPIAAIEAATTALGLIPERGVTVRVTGNPALNNDEMLGLIWDVGASGVASMVVICLLLAIALRSYRTMLAATVTLLVGLVWTAGFATLAVGRLNILSVAFGVLFIGLGVDFAIHLGLHALEDLRGEHRMDDAMTAAASKVGTAMTLCAGTTAIGFLSFVPTPYRGVAELGLIAGGGMLVILLLTFTLFPALTVLALPWASPHQGPHLVGVTERGERWIERHPAPVVGVVAALVAAALVVLPRLRFDSNVVTMRNQSTPSVEAFRELLSDRLRSPWSLDVLAPSLDEADRIAARLRRLDVVASARTLRDYVPTAQDQKRDILFDAALMLDLPSHGVADEPPPPPVDEQIATLRALRDVLARPGIRGRRGPLGRSIRRLRLQLDAFLRRVATLRDPRPALAELEGVLLGGFPAQIRRLQRALEPERVTLDSLPAELRERMLAPDGHARVQVFPKEDLSDTAALERFVDAVLRVEPDATGVAVNVLEFGRATVVSLQRALVLAFVAITILLAILLHRASDVVLVLAPLVVAGVLTGGAMVVLGVPFNFANVVVLPLLLGIGVDSGIHLVRTWSSDEDVSGAGLLGTTSARAVLFSAFTTMASFGSLALSPHRGIASLGIVLVIGMLITLAANLVFLPALLVLRERAR